MLSAADNRDVDNPYVRIAPAMNIELISGSDRTTQNLPTSDEVAFIINDETATETFRDVRVYLRNSVEAFTFTTISQTHSIYMPSHYVLLFPYEERGWD